MKIASILCSIPALLFYGETALCSPGPDTGFDGPVIHAAKPPAAAAWAGLGTGGCIMRGELQIQGARMAGGAGAAELAAHGPCRGGSQGGGGRGAGRAPVRPARATRPARAAGRVRGGPLSAPQSRAAPPPPRPPRRAPPRPPPRARRAARRASRRRTRTPPAP
jgi:hypothetical protein